jgi:hypothetical protein
MTITALNFVKINLILHDEPNLDKKRFPPAVTLTLFIRMALVGTVRKTLWNR